MSDTFDVIVLGAGMAGASLAAELAPRCKVLLLEAEDHPGRHATGRSAAMFFESYGNATVRALTRASRAFLTQPPEDFADVPLMSRRDGMIVTDARRMAQLESMLSGPAAVPGLIRLDAAAAVARAPILRPDWVAGAVLDESGHDMDVAALHQAYLRAARRGGARLVVDAREMVLLHAQSGWQVGCRVGRFDAPILVNAAGAWADSVARSAGVPPVGLQAMRRTAVTLPAPAGLDIRHWPLVIDVGEEFYFKPDAGQLLLSPANEDPMDPCDAAPDELDVALAVDRFENATTVQVRKLNHRWAGLRTFAPDRAPVVGYDDQAEGFFWLAGQGGYGIQMAPALARVAAALVLRNGLPADVSAEGVGAAAMSPSRLRAATH